MPTTVQIPQPAFSVNNMLYVKNNPSGQYFHFLNIRTLGMVLNVAVPRPPPEAGTSEVLGMGARCHDFEDTRCFQRGARTGNHCSGLVLAAGVGAGPAVWYASWELMLPGVSACKSGSAAFCLGK